MLKANYAEEFGIPNIVYMKDFTQIDTLLQCFVESNVFMFLETIWICKSTNKIFGSFLARDWNLRRWYKNSIGLYITWCSIFHLRGFTDLFLLRQDLKSANVTRRYFSINHFTSNIFFIWNRFEFDDIFIEHRILS